MEHRLDTFLYLCGFADLATDKVDVGWKKQPIAFLEPPHFHKGGVEITIAIAGCLHLVVDGEEVELKKGQFFVIQPGVVLHNPRNKEGTEIIVVKAPSASDDKFYADQNGRIDSC